VRVAAEGTLCGAYCIRIFLIALMIILQTPSWAANGVVYTCEFFEGSPIHNAASCHLEIGKPPCLFDYSYGQLSAHCQNNWVTDLRCTISKSKGEDLAYGVSGSGARTGPAPERVAVWYRENDTAPWVGAVCGFRGPWD
jgi:hypothetical protein